MKAHQASGWAWKDDWQDGFPTTAPVFSLPAGRTPSLLWGMGGNVGEWTGSKPCGYADGACLEQAVEVRGDQWVARDVLPIVTRGAGLPVARAGAVGFRCASNEEAASPENRAATSTQ